MDGKRSFWKFIWMTIKEDKAGSTFPEEAQIEVRGNTLKYVSRGGLKLEKAMENFDVTLEGKVCMDVGSSTGGFTDCMLQNEPTESNRNHQQCEKINGTENTGQSKTKP